MSGPEAESRWWTRLPPPPGGASRLQAALRAPVPRPRWDLAVASAAATLLLVWGVADPARAPGWQAEMVAAADRVPHSTALRWNEAEADVPVLLLTARDPGPPAHASSARPRPPLP